MTSNFSEMNDQQVVNLICDRRPASATPAEREIQRRGYIENRRGIWSRPNPLAIDAHGVGVSAGEFLICRPSVSSAR
jgi:hypothetical protein